MILNYNCKTDDLIIIFFNFFLKKIFLNIRFIHYKKIISYYIDYIKDHFRD